MKADEVRLYALRGGLKKQSVCYTHFLSNKVFRGDLILSMSVVSHFEINFFRTVLRGNPSHLPSFSPCSFFPNIIHAFIKNISHAHVCLADFSNRCRLYSLQPKTRSRIRVNNPKYGGIFPTSPLWRSYGLPGLWTAGRPPSSNPGRTFRTAPAPSFRW